MSDRKKVLVTGSTGYIASLVLPALRDRYDLQLIDIRKTNRDNDEVPGVEIVDLLTADRSELERRFSEAETVVHFGYIHPRPDAVYEDERKNVDMMQRVYDLATSCGVKRVVAASTNQATKWYEHPWHDGLIDRVSPEDFPRPESFYGWAKAAYESMGFVYACGSLGRKLEIVQVRIVAPREIDASN
ncbi:MAG: NAD-dependent epimerase/dehydratase family protein, partial [Thermomicrobiales bacterium]